MTQTPVKKKIQSLSRTTSLLPLIFHSYRRTNTSTLDLIRGPRQPGHQLRRQWHPIRHNELMVQQRLHDLYHVLIYNLQTINKLIFIQVYVNLIQSYESYPRRWTRWVRCCSWNCWVRSWNWNWVWCWSWSTIYDVWMGDPAEPIHISVSAVIWVHHR